MDYQQTIDYLFTRLPMFSRIGAAAIKNDLSNTIILCEQLGNPQKKFKSVHVAGTNGKGSTCHMLAAILQTAGYKTGLYTSPHLYDFRERIQINGEKIEKSFVVDFVKEMNPLIEEIEPSFFEITVAMAFKYFVDEKVDMAIIEVGLGGRLDSTNIITPELSVITNIGWDHMNLLGDNLQKIAWEKAGIIKKNIPVVIGETSPETRKIFETKAKEENAPIHFADQEQYITDWKQEKHGLMVTVANHGNDERQSYHLDLGGYYQTKNLVTVLGTVKQLQHKEWKISNEHIQEGLAHARKMTGLHGRWEIIHEHPTIVLDVAHNVDGMKQVMAQIELTDHYELHIIIGMVKDKEVSKTLALLPREANFYFTRASIPRSLPEDLLASYAKTAGLDGETYPDVNKALRAAISKAHKNDLILVCGSVFVVGEISREFVVNSQ